jgi:hypothetical protein
MTDSGRLVPVETVLLDAGLEISFSMELLSDEDWHILRQNLPIIIPVTRKGISAQYLQSRKHEDGCTSYVTAAA